ncbi:uncharacterized protein LOC143864361 isoform X2 [Tasmannia lanceolata]|uniref:uncharacterized protein LOC143864361 isoform X2 n=1 Tax=Tasmannia lanceolata TaxID=3420 RepID=UPI0040642D36
MVQAKASFLLHFNGHIKQDGSYDYLGGSIKLLTANRKIKFLELVSLIHSKIGTRTNEVSLSIRCRYVVDPLHVILYEVKDDDDLQSMMGIFDNKGYNSLCLYITKHRTNETINCLNVPFSTSIPPRVVPQDRQHDNEPLENEFRHADSLQHLDIPRDEPQLSADEVNSEKDFEDEFYLNQVHEQVDDVCTDDEDNNIDANIVEPHVDVAGQLDSTPSTSLPNLSVPIEDDEMVIRRSEDCEVGDVQYDLKVGATFLSLTHFKRLVREYAIRHRFMIVRVKSCSTKYSVRCKERNCPFRITGTKHLGFVKVKNFMPNHTCSFKFKGNDHPLVTSAWVAETCIGLFSRPADIKIDSIIDYIKVQWGVTISYRKAYLAKEIIYKTICEKSDNLHLMEEHATTLPPKATQGIWIL